jgi:anti-sigma B factor antagonist
METTFEIGEVSDGGVPVVAVRGEVDVATAPALRLALATKEEAEDPVEVVDLTAVTPVDSTALGVLVGVHRRLGEVGSVLRLVVTESRVRKVLEITGLIDVFGVLDTATAAVAG